ncbi:SDR family NAD(P)-dependent oxidoreductase [Brasilonema sp. UFV-L1]|uniref:SDR family NAD(P)-dependent oxidoreductase n=1 Tax=Brasilonema sp. UFV-L1 TaxID=2234130 RepID=UPI00145D1AF7|nr:SDR family NAD(P)-dependent oxidoreductase [Brasilonema sp. UFV-L1]NMG08659.1 oxidoreductase [Brasilonema sp. UFV-L1]
MAGKLEGKIAVVTGASSGIGRATAIALADEGAQVAIVARRKDRLESLAEHIGDFGGQALSIVADLTDEAQARQTVQQVNEKFGRVDILVNSAGVMLINPIQGVDTTEWRCMIDLNLLGLMYTTHAVLPLMKEQGEGHIVNISSAAGRSARAYVGVYNATKWGVNAFSEALRQELCKHNIRVTIIEPGAVATELADHITNPAIRQQAQAYYQSITPLEGKDIAAAILYAVTQPKYVNVNEILLLPTDQERAS